VAVGWHRKPIQYEAVSYCWGEDPSRASIKVNGVDFRVTASLAGALRRFRYLSRPRYLWADALCINQMDDEEKSAQVRSMLEIFRQARGVLVWLGEPREEIRKAVHGEALKNGMGTSRQAAVLDTMKKSRTVSCSHSLFGWVISNPEPITDRKSPIPEVITRSARQSGTGDLNPQVETLFKCLFAMCTKPWIRRVCIQQEIFAARGLQVFYGPLQLTLEEYKNCAHRLGSMSEWIDGKSLDNKARESLATICHMKRSKDRELLDLEILRLKILHNFRASRKDDEATIAESLLKGPHVGQVLSRSARFEASDPRDLVYALLGLTTCTVLSAEHSGNQDGNQLLLTIDYRKSVSEVFQEVTIYLLNMTRSLEPLGGVLARNRSALPSRLGEELPSWFLDWSRPGKGPFILFQCSRPTTRHLGWQSLSPDRTISLHGLVLLSFHRLRVGGRETLARFRRDKRFYCDSAPRGRKALPEWSASPATIKFPLAFPTEEIGWIQDGR
jgi:hypothetical protein